MSTLAEVFPPGDFIREELEFREWTQADLAEIMGRPTETINRIISGKLAITPETASGLGAAFGTSAAYWLNLESTHQLSRVSSDSDVTCRARLYEMAPISEMTKRHWIETSSNVKVLEKQVVDFYEMKGVEETPTMRAAAKKSTSYSSATPSQIAWYYFSKRLASSLEVPAFSKKKLVAATIELKQHITAPAEVRHVPRILAEVGIRFVVVKHLSKSKIDGAAFWLDKAKKKPVIALSMRYDRIDSFWHALLHELGHIRNGDDVSVDSDMVGETYTTKSSKPEYEQLADEFASTMLIDTNVIDDFILRVRPFYSKKKIIGFANRIGVHPGIVVGQLQYREEISYSHSREMLSKVRNVLLDSALSDGWNHQ